MRRLVLLFAILLPLSSVAHADDASKRAKIDDLFAEMHMDHLMQEMMTNMEHTVVPMTQQLFGGKVPEPMQKQVANMQRQMFDMIEQQMSWKAMEPAYTEIYARNFTEDQIDGIVAFYKTPAGQAMIEKMPLLATEGMQASQAKMTTLMPQIRKMMDDFATQNAEAIKKARASSRSGT